MISHAAVAARPILATGSAARALFGAGANDAPWMLQNGISGYATGGSSAGEGPGMGVGGLGGPTRLGQVHWHHVRVQAYC